MSKVLTDQSGRHALLAACAILLCGVSLTSALRISEAPTLINFGGSSNNFNIQVAATRAAEWNPDVVQWSESDRADSARVVIDEVDNTSPHVFTVAVRNDSAVASSFLTMRLAEASTRNDELAETLSSLDLMKITVKDGSTTVLQSYPGRTYNNLSYRFPQRLDANEFRILEVTVESPEGENRIELDGLSSLMIEISGESV